MFVGLQRMVEACGFHLDRVRGDHHIYQHPQIPEMLNLQSTRGQANPYQIRQFLAMVEKYHLRPGAWAWRTITSTCSGVTRMAAMSPTSPDLVHCSAFGDTPEEALRQVLIAKEAWLESARERAGPVPEPRYRPVHAT